MDRGQAVDEVGAAWKSLIAGADWPAALVAGGQHVWDLRWRRWRLSVSE